MSIEKISRSHVHLYVALMHYPIQNRHGLVVPTAVTNLDIHDISRTSKTYGAENYFIVTPVDENRAHVDRILRYWRDPKQKEYHPDRFEALEIVQLVASFDEVIGQIEKKEGLKPEVVLTDARVRPNSVSYADYRRRLEDSSYASRPILIVLGTGWGLAEDFFQHADVVLDPIFGPAHKDGYNHLSVRAAAGVILDRLFGH